MDTVSGDMIFKYGRLRSSSYGVSARPANQPSMSTREVYTVDRTILRTVLLKDLGTNLSCGKQLSFYTSTMAEWLYILQVDVRTQEQ